MSVSELVAVLRPAFRAEDYDKVEEVLESKYEKLQVQVEKEKLERIHLEEQLRKRVEEFDRGKKDKENYENLLKIMKEAGGLASGHDSHCIDEMKKKIGELELEKKKLVDGIEELRKKNVELVCENYELNEMKEKWVDDSSALAELRIRVSVLEEEKFNVHNALVAARKRNEEFGSYGLLVEKEEKDEENEEENENGVPDKSDDEMPEQSVSEDRNDSDNESENVKTPRKRNKVSSTKKESAEKSKKIITVERKPRSAPKRISKKPLATHESDDDSEESPKVSSRKKKNEKQGKQKTSTVTKFSSSKEKTEKVTRGRSQSKGKLNPSDGQIRDAICESFKEIDFNTVRSCIIFECWMIPSPVQVEFPKLD
ncbi:uncharacterized protein LOC130732781 [Lotus japonicus]|uniref:uncharacterized protein LOC130732781 n=1 Tax=Lotus japonicus TaxID=34305 RepID=UPI0025907B86|nr:uncharacterized protein LOC130732781 [Lotus japonicus]